MVDATLTLTEVARVVRIADEAASVAVEEVLVYAGEGMTMLLIPVAELPAETTELPPETTELPPEDDPEDPEDADEFTAQVFSPPTPATA